VSSATGAGAPPGLWTEPEVVLVQPRKVAAGTDGRFFGPGEQLLGSLQGTQYGRRGGIEVRDPSGGLLLTVNRTGWNRPRSELTWPDGSELGRVVSRAHLLRRSEWEVTVRTAAGEQVIARSRPARAGRTLVTSIVDANERALADVEGTVSAPVLMRVVDTASAYRLVRHHPPEPWTGAMEIGVLVAMDVALRAARAQSTHHRI